MAFTQLNQLSIAFKKLSGKTHTNSSFGASNESIGSNIQVGASTVFGDPIPLSPNGSLWSITSGVVEKVRFELSSLPTSQYQASAGGLSGTSIDDSGDGAPTIGAFSNGIHAYALKLTGSYETDSTNPLAGTTPFTNGYFPSGSGGTLQIIPESFGGVYSAAVYESDGTTLIPPLDEVDYYLDPYAGVLFVQDYDSATTPTFVDVYIYIGEFVTDKITQAGIFSQTGSFYATTNDIQITGSLKVSGGVTGSFSGSFQGDGSALTGIAATLAISGSTGNGTVDLKTQALTIQGTANEITTSGSGQTITVGLPTNVVIAGDLTVNGTTTTINTTNLLIEDKFALFASGAINPTDGGIVIQSNSTGTGFALGYNSGSGRWALEAGLSGTSTGFSSPNAFVGTVETGSTSPIIAPAYGGSTNGYGTIFVNKTAEDIWIYA